MSAQPPMNPKDQQNLLVAIALSLLVIFGWQAFVEGPRHAREQAARDAALAAENRTAAAPTADAVPEAPQAEQTPVAPRGRTEVLAEDPRLPISTPSLHGTLNLRGGRLDDLTLARYRETVSPDSPEIVLLSPSGTEAPYYAEFGWSGSAGVKVPDRTTLWQASGSVLAPGKPVVLTWSNGDGLTFERRIELDPNYMFTITQTVRNDGTAPVTVTPYGLVARTADATARATLDHHGPIGVFNNELAQDTYKNLTEKGLVKRTTTGGWFGFVDKYWLVALVPDPSAPVDVREMQAKRVADNRFQTDFSLAARTVAPGASDSVTTRLFAGAKEVRTLDSYAKKLGIPHFDLAIDFGWLYFLTKPFFYALDFLAKLLGNYGYAILAFTVIVKLLLFPLAEKSGISMAKMKKLTPKMTELRETHANDQQRLSKEMIELYKREKVNPMSGCWPMLIQIPIFFALYKVLYVSIEMRHVPFSWVTDLAAADPSNVFTLFGFFAWTPPTFLHLGAWPLLMATTMALQMKMNPPPPDPTQKIVFTLMPWMLMITMAQMPAGLLLYWTWSNMLSMLQQYVIMKRMHVRTFD